MHAFDSYTSSLESFPYSAVLGFLVIYYTLVCLVCTIKEPFPFDVLLSANTVLSLRTAQCHTHTNRRTS